MDLVLGAGGIGGHEVEVELGAGGEDEPAVLSAHGEVETEAVHVVLGGVEHETGGNAKVPAVLVVLVEMGEFDGDKDCAGGRGGLLAVVGGGGDAIAQDADMAVAEEGVAIAEADVEVPTAGNGAMIVEGDADIGAYGVVVVVLAIHAAVEECADGRIGGEARLTTPLGVMLGTFGFLFGSFLGFAGLVLGLGLLAFLAVFFFLYLFLASLFSFFLHAGFFFGLLALELFLLFLLLAEEVLLLFLLLFLQGFLLTLDLVVALGEGGACTECHGD